MNRAVLLIPAVALILAFSQLSCLGGAIVSKTTYKFIPEEFEDLHLDRSNERNTRMSRSRQVTYLAPPIPDGMIEGVWLNMPATVIIDTEDLESMRWEHAKLPVCVSFCFFNDSYQRHIDEHFAILKDLSTDEEMTVKIDLNRYDHAPNYKAGWLTPGEMRGETAVYNITYFTDLPAYSAEYEVQVKIADLVSNPMRVRFELRENGKPVLRKAE